MKKIFILLALAFGWMLTAQAQTFTVGTLNYSVLDADARTVSVTGSTVKEGELIIPETVNYNGTDYTVTTIGKLAFYECTGFTGSLTIPESVITIEEEAFLGCTGFTGSLTISNSVTTIGDYAFINCSGFTGSLTIGSSVISIGRMVFRGCSGFTGSLIIPNSVTTIGDEAFNGCTGFTGSLTIPELVTNIGNYTFYGCSGFTGSLTIPESVARIGFETFRDCSGFTGSLTIPNSVTFIGNNAFYDCPGFTDIYCYAINPPTVGNTYAFTNYTIPLYVPKGTKEVYQSADVWKLFTNITDNLQSGVGTVGADDGPVDVYSVSGMVVKKQVMSDEAKEGLAPGIYILIDRFGRTQKITVR